MLLASPNPWRPVDLPRHLQQGSGQTPDEQTPADLPGAGEIVDVAVDKSALPACGEQNETLNRKRPRRDCTVEPPIAQ